MIQLAFKKAVHKADWNILGWKPPVFDGWYGFLIYAKQRIGSKLNKAHASLCHVELVFKGSEYGDRNSFSARCSKDKKEDGVTFKNINYSHPENWEFIDIPEAYLNSIGANEQEIHAECLKLEQTNKGYAYNDIIINQGGLNSKYDDPERFFCSEVCSKELRLPNDMLDPGTLFVTIKEAIKNI